MKTYTYEETFDDGKDRVLTEEQAEILQSVGGCGITGEPFKVGEEMVRVLMPTTTSAGYVDDVIVKAEALKAKGYRFFRGEIPRIALPEEID